MIVYQMHLYIYIYINARVWARDAKGPTNIIEYHRKHHSQAQE